MFSSLPRRMSGGVGQALPPAERALSNLHLEAQVLTLHYYIYYIIRSQAGLQSAAPHLSTVAPHLAIMAPHSATMMALQLIKCQILQPLIQPLVS